MSSIIDTHVHLYDLPDPLGALAASAEAGVEAVIALGVDLASNRTHLALVDQLKVIASGGDKGGNSPEANKSCRVHVGLGLHPGNIVSSAETQACLDFIRAHVSRAIAIGETGLDYWYKWVRKDDALKRQQRDVFEMHLKLAHECALPVVIHSRGAWRDCFDMARASGVSRAVFHWYSGPQDVLRDILDKGFYISCTPSLVYSQEARQAVGFAPMEQVLVETDTPVPYPSLNHDSGGLSSAPDPADDRRPSIPKDVWRTLRLLSEVRGLNEQEVLAQVNANALRCFGLS